ncbi:MAG: PQQ-like beta-propeller repeat protein [Candidatus Bathyarchaeota archaeon]|nr:PQQ-like beta-propeller repeat protein [Candidatus Bathyarchaeota archaeon]
MYKTANTQLNSKRQYVKLAAALALTAIILLSCLQIAPVQAKTKTFGFLNANPTVVGLGQTILFNSWVTPQPPMFPGTSDGIKRTGYYYDFTKPDGSTFTEGPRTSDGAGTDWFVITADELGTWKVKFRWAGDDLYEGCETVETTFVVQQDPPPGWSETPLPEGYWTRPISAADRGWYVIGGAWMQSTGRDSPCFNPYSTGPDTAHVLWTVETGMGGLIGGEYGATDYSCSAPSKVIMYGRAYYVANGAIHCVDVHTGEEIWNPPVPTTARSVFALPGPTPYLWALSSNRFERFDASTGESTKIVTGQPGGDELINLLGSSRSWRMNRQWLDSNGIFYINIDDSLERFIGTLAYDTKVSSTNFYAGVLWHIQRESMNSTTVHLYDYPYGNSTAEIIETYTMPIQDLASLAVDTANGIVFHLSNGGNSTAALNATTGELMWNIQREYYIEGQGVAMNGVGSCGATDTMKVYGFDLYTGEQIWESEPSTYPWGGFRAYSAGADYNNFYFLAYDGTIRAYDINTGNIEWTVSSGVDVSGETPYGTWPFYNNPAIVNGKVYATTAEHTPTHPLKRGDKLYGINSETGDVMWSILGCNQQIAISDGVLVASDSYTPVLYGFDKGQTETTVVTSQKIAARDAMVLFEGTVMDLSPAQPNTPAISDEDMSAWMEYIHMYQPKPDATGVQVHLTAIDPNGNLQDIGYATSDSLGNYAITWIPPVPGLYTVTATFEGSGAYYSSEAGTSFVALETAATPAASPSTPSTTQTPATPTPIQPASPSPSEAPQPPTSSTPTETYIVIGAAVIIIVAAAAALLLRQRK